MRLLIWPVASVDLESVVSQALIELLNLVRLKGIVTLRRWGGRSAVAPIDASVGVGLALAGRGNHCGRIK